MLQKYWQVKFYIKTIYFSCFVHFKHISHGQDLNISHNNIGRTFSSNIIKSVTFKMCDSILLSKVVLDYNLVDWNIYIINCSLFGYNQSEQFFQNCTTMVDTYTSQFLQLFTQVLPKFSIYASLYYFLDACKNAIN